jgi:cysteine desulfuration protein SufE
MKRIEDIEQEILDDLAVFGDDWEGKYEYLIDLGKELAPMEEKYKTDDNLIRGCQSRVWLHSELKDGRVIFHADSDAIITRGLVALMVKVLSNQEPADIVKAELQFIRKAGLGEHLSPTRANGLLSMVRRMKSDALALSAQSEK